MGYCTGSFSFSAPKSKQGIAVLCHLTLQLLLVFNMNLLNVKFSFYYISGVELNEPAYLKLSHSINENLLNAGAEVKPLLPAYLS